MAPLTCVCDGLAVIDLDDHQSVIVALWPVSLATAGCRWRPTSARGCGHYGQVVHSLMKPTGKLSDSKVLSTHALNPTERIPAKS